MSEMTSSSLKLSFPLAEKPVSDLQTHTSYLTKSAVNLLPIRRQLRRNSLAEALIPLRELSPPGDQLLLRVKHTAVNFARDFDTTGVVPSSRIVGKIPVKAPIEIDNVVFSPKDKLFVFPCSTCWIENAQEGNAGFDSGGWCTNCVEVVRRGHSYESHRQFPCLQPKMLGRQLDGGLQDYISVKAPAHTLIKVPGAVSLHDCCFLLDVAVPFLSFCTDSLEVNDRVLVILENAATEANDCLLVLHHLQLDPQAFTFTDISSLNANPELGQDAANKFRHVLVFAAGQQALDVAMDFLMPKSGSIAVFNPETRNRGGSESSTSSESYFSGKSISGSSYSSVSDTAGDEIAKSQNRASISKFKLSFPAVSYKDKYLMEDLLATIASINSAPRMQKLSLAGTSTNSSKVIRAKGHADILSMVPLRKKKQVSWLYCDRDFRLCSDDNCEHDPESRCQSTVHINEMLRLRSSLRRVFYTNPPPSHVKLNAFIF